MGDRPRIQEGGRCGERNVRSSVDATQVNERDHEEGVQAVTRVIASKTILSVATKVNVKDVGWRNMKAWCGKYKTSFGGNIKNILMRDLVIGVPTSFASENHGYVVVHRGIDFPSSSSGKMPFVQVLEQILQRWDCRYKIKFGCPDATQTRKRCMRVRTHHAQRTSSRQRSRSWSRPEWLCST